MSKQDTSPERNLTYRITCTRSEQHDDYGPTYHKLRTFDFGVAPGQDVHQEAARVWGEIAKRGNATFHTLELVEKVDWDPNRPTQQAAA